MLKVNNFYNSLIMQKPQNLFYRWEVLQNVGAYLSLHELLNTATLSKEYNFVLKKYIKDRFALTNNQDQFQQLKSLFNRKIYLYNKNDKFAKQHPSNVIIRNIQTQEKYSVVQTVDAQYKLVQTDTLILGQAITWISLPQKFEHVHITEANILYCSSNQKIYRYNLNSNEGLFNQVEVLEVQGKIQNIVCGFRYTICLISCKPDQLKLRIFDNSQPLGNFKDAELPFQLAYLNTKDSLVLGKTDCYFLYNQTIYNLNLKYATVNHYLQLSGKKIVKILGGKLHFMAYERTEQLSSNWTANDVLKFAQREGLQDYIQIFKAQKVTGKTLLQMDKKYMQEVLGVMNVKIQQKLTLKIAEYNKENPQNYVLYGWGRASEGALGTNPSKQITKPIKVKLPNDHQVFCLSGLYTFIQNTKNNHTLVNSIDQRTNKLQWKQLTNRKIWNLDTVGDSVVLIAADTKQKLTKRESESVIEQKKQKLRTTKNIIDKITWDQNLNSQEFRVGYLDIYDGILQIPFEELKESEIKEYRIEYFKRGNQVVWHKKKRIDIL